MAAAFDETCDHGVVLDLRAGFRAGHRADECVETVRAWQYFAIGLLVGVESGGRHVKWTSLQTGVAIEPRHCTSNPANRRSSRFSVTIGFIDFRTSVRGRCENMQGTDVPSNVPQ